MTCGGLADRGPPSGTIEIQKEEFEGIVYLAIVRVVAFPCNGVLYGHAAPPRAFSTALIDTRDQRCHGDAPNGARALGPLNHDPAPVSSGLG